MDDVHSADNSATAKQVADNSKPSFAELKPKGACWYCNQPLDSVRRFCSKACANDYRTEEETFKNE
jgi:hypothetical protein